MKFNIFKKPLPIVYSDIKELPEKQYRIQYPNGRDWITKINGNIFESELSVKTNPKFIKVKCIFKADFYEQFKAYESHAISYELAIFDNVKKENVLRADCFLHFIGFNATDNETVTVTYWFKYAV